MGQPDFRAPRQNVGDRKPGSSFLARVRRIQVLVSRSSRSASRTGQSFGLLSFVSLMFLDPKEAAVGFIRRHHITTPNESYLKAL